MNRVLITLCLTLAGLTACADDLGPSAPIPEVDAVALTGIRGALIGSSPAVLDPVTAPAASPVKWSFQPPVLQVFRATAVHLSVVSGLENRPQATCRWNFGDGSPSAEGCKLSHTFHGGQADQVVTLQVTDGDWSTKTIRTIPLERLPIDPTFGKEGTAGPEDPVGALPAPPPEGRANLRVAFIADSAADGGVHQDVRAGIEGLIENVRPGLVIHMGGMVTAKGGGAGWGHFESGISEALQAASIPLVTALSPADRAAGTSVPGPTIQLVDGAHYPERFTFTSQGAFFLVFGAGDEGVSEETIRWMRDQLGQARIYEARYVVSYLPLHKFGDRHVGSLDKRFRLYEIFLRSRVTALITAGYRVYFKGRYGALPVVSVGALAGSGARLSGVDFTQPSSFVVIDQLDGVPERIFSVVGPHFDQVFDESNLPDNVEVYTR
jgi:hypothetical protein